MYVLYNVNLYQGWQIASLQYLQLLSHDHYCKHSSDRGNMCHAEAAGREGSLEQTAGKLKNTTQCNMEVKELQNDRFCHPWVGETICLIISLVSLFSYIYIHIHVQHIETIFIYIYE